MKTVCETAAPTTLSSADSVELPLTVIESRPGWQFVNVRELWVYRELFVFLAWRDITVRYKQTVLGAAWAILQPLATMIVFVFCLGRIAADPSAAVPYPLYLFAGLLPWMFFAGAVTAAAGSLVGNQNLVTKVYFPRLLIPGSAIGASAVDFLIAFLMLLALMLLYGIVPGLGLLAVPALALMLAVAALGVGTLLCALTVSYRDFRHVVPFLVQLWMFATPCIYLQSGGGQGRLLFALNPVHGLIMNFRAAVLGAPFNLPALLISSLVSFALLVAGMFYFRRMEREFADII
jgi:lipopolysaccharide transport system permease protein